MGAEISSGDKRRRKMKETGAGGGGGQHRRQPGARGVGTATGPQPGKKGGHQKEAGNKRERRENRDGKCRRNIQWRQQERNGMKWSTSRQNTRRIRERGRAQGGAGRGERRVMWRDLVLESGAGLSNAAKCRLRKSEWTLLAFADGSKLFVATRDLSPTIFHFKEKWKQLFDLGILGAPWEGVGRGEGTGVVGKGGRSGRSKSEQRPWRGGGEDGEAAENKRRVREAGACVCVCVRACLPLCLSTRTRTTDSWVPYVCA